MFQIRAARDAEQAKADSADFFRVVIFYRSLRLSGSPFQAGRSYQNAAREF
jgi:hypothetical protein